MLRSGIRALRRAITAVKVRWRRLLAWMAARVPARAQPKLVRRILLPAAVRELGTADLRRLVDRLARERDAATAPAEVSESAGASDRAAASSAGRTTTDVAAPDAADGPGPADVALLRALLPGIHASPFAGDRLAAACADAPDGLRRAVAERLLAHGRGELAWRVVSTDPQIRFGPGPTRRLIALLTDAAALESLADEVAMPGRPRTRQALRAEAMIARGRIASGHDHGGRDLATARTWFDRAEAAWPTPASATWIARVLLAEDTPVDAARWVETALERDPHDREALLTAADLQLTVGDPAKAVVALAVIAADPSANTWQLDSVWRTVRERVDRSDAEVALHAWSVEEAVAERLGASGGPMGVAAWAVTRWWAGDREVAEERMAPLWAATDAVSLRAYAQYLGRTGRSAEAYEVLGRMSVLMRGERACSDLVAALRADGHVRLADQAAQRASEVFPQLREQPGFSGD